MAAQSGYDEFARAPLFFVGHSAGGPQARDCAIKLAHHCFGVVQYRGGAPGDSKAVPPDIPALMKLGQFDECGSPLPLLGRRGSTVEAGAGGGR